MPLGFIIFCLIMSLATGIMATDLYIPCIALMKIDFTTTQAAVQRTIGIALLGACLSSLIAGPLTDYYGKQRVFSGAMILFVVTGILSPLSPTIQVLTVLRFAQGIAIGVLPVIILALLTQLYSGKKLTQIISIVGVVLTVTLSLGPVIGGWIGSALGWKGCFWLSAGVIGVLLIVLWGRIPIVQQPSAYPFSLSLFITEARTLLKSKSFLFYASLHGLCFSSALTLRSTLSHYGAEVLHFSPLELGQFLSVAMVANTLAGLIISFWALRLDTAYLLKIGIGLALLSAVGYLVISYFCPLRPEALMGVLVIQNISVPLCFTSTLSLAMQQPGMGIGLMSSLIISWRNFLASIFVYVGGALYRPHLWSIAGVFAFSVFIQVLLYLHGKSRKILSP